MRDQDELQRAHDMFVAILLGECPQLEVGPQTKERIHIATDVLCWVLNHDHNQAFAKNLAAIEDQARTAGYILENKSN